MEISRSASCRMLTSILVNPFGFPYGTIPRLLVFWHTREESGLRHFLRQLRILTPTVEFRAR
jgi:hypothetical protein